MQIEFDQTEKITNTQMKSDRLEKSNIDGLTAVIVESFPDKLESVKVYVLEKSPFSIIYEDLEFNHPFESCDFIDEGYFNDLTTSIGVEPNVLSLSFPDYDMILELRFEQQVRANDMSHDDVTEFTHAFDRCLKNTIKDDFGKLSIMNRLNQTIFGCLDLETIFSSLALELKMLQKFDRLALCTFHPQYNSFRIEAVYAPDEDEFNFMKQYLRIEDSNLGCMLDAQKPVTFTVDEKVNGYIGSRLLRLKIKSVLLCPIRDRGELIASLQIASRDENAFDEVDSTFLMRVCQLIGRAIVAARKYADLRNLLNDYRDAQDMFLHTERYRNFIDITRGVLHSFNNHLALIMGRAQLLGMLSGDVIERAKLDKGLDVILRATTAASDQISALQKYARTREQEEPDQIQVKGLVEEIVGLSMPRWKSVGRGKIEIKYDIDSQIHIDGDRKKIRDALINILMNAVEAEQTTGGEVLIDASTNSSATTISVIDNGVGMSAKQIAKAYKPFFSTKEEGTGLGLSVSYRVVREHGGDINIKSTPDKGTTVEIVFPKSNHAKSMIGGDEASTGVSKVVIIDPQKIHLKLLASLLEGMGLETKNCTDINQYHAAVEDFKPDLVIWDDSCMDCDLKEFISKIKDAHKNILTCMVGASFDDADQQRFISSGVNALLSKPYEKTVVLNMLQKVSKSIDRM